MVSLVGDPLKRRKPQILRKRHLYPDQRSSQIIAPCVASAAARTELERTKWPDRQHK